MRTLLVACGNPLRRDDGVAHRILRHIVPGPDRELRSVQQLLPEMAQEIACFERVIFLDADVGTTQSVIEQMGAPAPRSPLTHAADPAEIVALSRVLFGFQGEAFVCRIPARDFSPGEIPREPDILRKAAGELERLCHLA